jgi:hypothetical protein
MHPIVAQTTPRAPYQVLACAAITYIYYPYNRNNLDPRHNQTHTHNTYIQNMDPNHHINRVPLVSPIPTTLKRKRGPSLSGDPPSGKPVLKQSKDASADALADLDELEEEMDGSDFGSESSGKINSIRKAIHSTSSANTN